MAKKQQVEPKMHRVNADLFLVNIDGKDYLLKRPLHIKFWAKGIDFEKDMQDATPVDKPKPEGEIGQLRAGEDK